MKIGEVIYENGPVTLAYAGEIDGHEMGVVTSEYGESPPAPIISLLARGGWVPVEKNGRAATLEQWL